MGWGWEKLHKTYLSESTTKDAGEKVNLLLIEISHEHKAHIVSACRRVEGEAWKNVRARKLLIQV